jgi:hypothetical protein
MEIAGQYSDELLTLSFSGAGTSMLGAAVLHFSGLALVGAALRWGRAHWTHQGAKGAL